MMITYKGIVADSLTGEPLPGAVLSIIVPGGVVYNYSAAAGGKIEITSIRFRNMVLEVALLGYKIHRRPLSTDLRAADLGTIRLSQDVQEIDAIEVKARMQLYRISGDTVIYNPRAVKVRNGASTLELISKLPGAEIGEGGVSIGGKPIERTYVNGDKLFGEDPMDALKYLESKEVSSILVYDEADEKSADRRKRRVINLLTFRGIASSANANLAGGAGADITPDNARARYLGEADLKFFSVKRQFSLTYAGNNLGLENSSFDYNRIADKFASKNAALQARTGENRLQNIDLSYRDQITPNATLQVGYGYGYRSHRDRTISQNIYFPTEAYATRLYADTARNSSILRRHSAFLEYENEGKSHIRLTGKYTYDEAPNLTRSSSATELDAAPLARQQFVRKSNKDSQGYAFTLYGQYPRKIFAGNLSAFAQINGGNSNANENRLDTLSSSTDRYHIRTVADKNNISAHGSLSYYMELLPYSHTVPTSEHLQLKIAYHGAYEKEKRSQLATDKFSGLIDPSQTYDYTNEETHHTGDFAVTYNAQNNEFMLASKLEFTRQSLDDRTPARSIKKNDYLWLMPTFTYTRNLKGLRYLRFSYSYWKSAPGIAYLSDRLDNRNPLLLQGGNPDLKPTGNHDFDIHYNGASNTAGNDGYLQVQLRTSLKKQEPVIRQQFFDTPAHLPRYDYTTAAGATLTTMENSPKTSTYVNFMFGYDKRISPISCMFAIRTVYDYQNRAAYVGEQLLTSRSHIPGMDLSLRSNFSTKMEFKLYAQSGFKHEKTSSEEMDRAVKERIGIDFRLDFFKRMTFQSTYEYYLYHSFDYAQNRFATHLWNASLGVGFLKENSGELRFSVYDLLNNNRNFVSTMYADHIGNRWTQLYSRYFTVSIFLKFNRLD